MASCDTQAFTARCYCKSLHYTLTLPTSALPLSTHICHCSLCRYTHGTMCIFHADIPPGINPHFVEPSSLETSTTLYKQFRFCSTCGAHMGGYNDDKNSWSLTTALLSKKEGAFIVDEHIFTKSAPAGFQDWLPKIGDRDLRVWNPDDETAESAVPKAEYAATGDERLRVQCHCGGISFTINRPTEEVLNDSHMNKSISPIDKTKWKARLDACNDCRLISGVEINAWIFVPLMVCEPKIGPDFKHGTMKSYQSSEDVTRTFCGVCGATVFYWTEDLGTNNRDIIVNIAAGLLRAPEGVRAENWVTWRIRIGWLEAGCEYEKEVCGSLQRGVEEWGAKAYEKGKCEVELD